MRIEPVISDETLESIALFHGDFFCPSFSKLWETQQKTLYLEASKRAHISIYNTVINALFENKALSMSIEAQSAQRLYDDVIRSMIDSIDDCIDEYNDAIEEARSEPARPQSDFI